MVHSRTEITVPIGFGFYHIAQSVLMGSMHTGLEEDSEGFERMAVFFALRAKGGVGLIVTGGFTRIWGTGLR